MASAYKTSIQMTGTGPTMGPQLQGISRCPHCSIASPSLTAVWRSQGPTPRTDGGPSQIWATFLCASCGSAVTCRAEWQQNWGATVKHSGLFPDAKTAHTDIPEPARTFLQQAFETLHAPDAAAVMAGSAVDAMLKNYGLVDGSLYKRIDEALQKNMLTQGMADWAHEVRLGSNRPRHADANKPHVTPDEARQSVEFAEALGNFLYVLTARISRGLEDAKVASGPETTNPTS